MQTYRSAHAHARADPIGIDSPLGHLEVVLYELPSVYCADAMEGREKDAEISLAIFGIAVLILLVLYFIQR
jgi:hypothetical protein